jgi:hypothetical protein
MSIKYINISKPRPSKIYPNWDFWFENKPSGNPASSASVARHHFSCKNGLTNLRSIFLAIFCAPQAHLQQLHLVRTFLQLFGAAQGDQMSLLKNFPKCSPTLFSYGINTTFTFEKVGQKFRLLL